VTSGQSYWFHHQENMPLWFGTGRDRDSSYQPGYPLATASVPYPH
jgi:hypothetical protein